MKACTTRLPLGDWAFFSQEAENRGTTVGDLMREACKSFREKLTLAEELAQLEKRFFRKVFEAQCVVAGLTSAEREQAMHDLKQRMKGPSV